ncbi:OLC1v1020586C1 [Oldenlandia corymbosa var. corymbosa]|uniref:OLC1v1020586C1 n=1 Tax=Oldenlandia corymbosa var. corymbosa TaxID=529605 RepID=A0AAV1EH86_OLDCO|nr:OLC1v1020586C1 [Oldenlandia corymbosa var. corymbosa]
MEISLISDTLKSIVSTQAGLSLGFSRFLIASSDQSPTGSLQISATMFPFDAVAPRPPVKSSRVKTLPRRQLKQRRRTRKRSLTSDDDGGSGDGEEIFGFFAGDGDGPFNNNNNGGGGGYGGGNWNFGRDEFFSDDNGSNNSYQDPAFDFVYEVLSWIVLSNCLHFAYNKLMRIVADGFSDPAREKVAIQLESVC